jgi:hypothetical protein
VVVKALRDGFKTSSHDDATLVINILHKHVFDRVRNSIRLGPDLNWEEGIRNEQVRRPIRVFMSYAHSSPEHKKWVETLGTFLRHNGIDARLDTWHLRSGMDISQFMANELALADRVIIISDEKYADKADGRIGGAGWETMLIQGDKQVSKSNLTMELDLLASKREAANGAQATERSVRAAARRATDGYARGAAVPAITGRTGVSAREGYSGDRRDAGCQSPKYL